jgi:hypothetical protein
LRTRSGVPTCSTAVASGVSGGVNTRTIVNVV